MARKLVCWKDGFDLTSLVTQHLAGRRGTVILKEDEEPPAPWRFLVKCPDDEAENVFASDVVLNQPDGATVVGAQPSPADVYLSEAAKEIAPAKSLTRASDSAKFTIDKIALVALVLGGFGIFTDLGGGFSEEPWWFGIVTVASAAALVFAVIALFPRTEENVNYANLLEVEQAYEKAINRRAGWAQAAAAALIFGLLAALGAFWFVSDRDARATVTTSWDGSGARGVLGFAVDMKDLPSERTPAVRLIGLQRRTHETGTELASIRGRRAESGTAKVEQKLVPPDGYAAFLVEASIISDEGKRQVLESVTVDPPAFVAPPQMPQSPGGS